MIFKSEIEFYKSILPTNKIIFDVGCRNDNIFYELSPKAEIHLFDPNINLSIKNKIKNLDNVHFNNIALGNELGVKKFHFKYGSFLYRDKEKFKGLHECTDVIMDTLYNYCQNYGIENIFLLKIDTEGYDFEVILGAKKLINSIDYVQFELFDGYANGKTIDDILRYLKGWTIYKLIGKPINLVATKHKLNLPEF